MSRLAALYAAFLCLSACQAETKPVFHAEGNPQTLSEWGQVSVSKDALRLSNGVTAYDLNTPLFSDYAQKLRTVWIEGGKPATYSETDVFDFPVGTVITKTFYYAKGGAQDEVLKINPESSNSTALRSDMMQLIETRVLARRKDGWVALPYVWNNEQTEAVLARTGDAQKLTMIDGDAKTPFTYVVPNVNQCAGCHAIDSNTKAIQPIGPKARHLNHDKLYGDKELRNQLVHWVDTGLLESAPENAPANADWKDASRSVDERARAYLDINCSHCHSKTGPADTSGLHLTPETPIGPHLGICKTPIAAGRGTGNRVYGIVPGDADASIVTYRMASKNPAIMMPELGRAVEHQEGVALIREWINGLDGSCAN